MAPFKMLGLLFRGMAFLKLLFFGVIIMALWPYIGDYVKEYVTVANIKELLGSMGTMMP